jgi:hypothetical protein
MMTNCIEGPREKILCPNTWILQYKMDDIEVYAPSILIMVSAVASRPRFGCYSLARTGSAIQKVAERGGLRQ